MSLVWSLIPGVSNVINAASAAHYYSLGNYLAATLYAVASLPLPFSSLLGVSSSTAVKAMEAGSLPNKALHLCLQVLSNPQHVAAATSVILWLSGRLEGVPGVGPVAKLVGAATNKAATAISAMFGAADGALRKFEWSKQQKRAPQD